ncbi:coiled-coil domain containing 147 [Tritrichomonas foetus]|uniref:Coiled-coil domain containing 147 n=1 Tax=Tritrichomonas foetus TaxID=1144522 RepID=A0A1J4L3D3_9EUKA|nr:coiled-coil domain containing 147 [Tritrichomonas foetus]|eukprot:OHT16484.1 coiled-coil domain containing 147 [Tritrichomonas foetus]
MSDANSEKPSNQPDDLQDEMESFDDMEKNFHRVVQDLVNDRTLDNFRVEYENLHKALVTSHEHNGILIEKCKKLNNEILANANKVSSVMNLSQDDQRTIAGLRHEFEKAWKMVEVSQERENKSRDVIDGMKVEISNLSRLVEQGGAMAFTQEASLQEITDEIAQLKKEIIVQTTQLETMTKDVTDSKNAHKTMKETLEKLTNEFHELTTALEAEKENNKIMSANTEATHSEIKSVKDEYNELQKVFDQKIEEINEKKAIIEELNDAMKEEVANMKSANEDERMNHSMIKTVEKVLEDKIKANNKLKDDVKAYDYRFQLKDEEMEKLNDKLRVIKNEYDKTKVFYDEIKGHQKMVNEEKDHMRTKVNECRKEIYLLTAEHFETTSNNLGLRRDMEKHRTEYHTIISKKGTEKGETKFVEEQNKILVNEMLGMKVVSHDQRKKIANINQEIEQYKVRGSEAKSNRFQIQEEVRIREELLDAKNIDLSKAFEQIKKQDSMLETMQNERDFACRQLELAIKGNEEIDDENKALILTIRGLKDDIRNKDKLCLETHMKAKKIVNSLAGLTRDVMTLKEKIKELDSLCTEHRNKIQRSLYLIGQADLDIKKQKQVVSDIQYSSLSLDSSVTKRANEIQILQEKAETVKSLINTGASVYRQLNEKVKIAHEELLFEVKKHQELLGKVDHRRALQLELIRIQKSLLQESGKCRALEDELEKPMNVHRWRFIEGTNPELAQLLRMTHELRDRLMMQISAMQRIKETQKTVQEKAKTMENHLTNSYNGDYDEEFKFLSEVLRQKQQQFHLIQQKVNEQQTNVESQKELVNVMRNMVREEKTEYFESKKKVDQIRATTSLSTARTTTRSSSRNANPNASISVASNVSAAIANKQPTSQCETKFIGGGFAVGGIARKESPDKTDKKCLSPASRLLGTKSALASPHIVQPKSASTIQKRNRPPGWNPQRGAMKPFLPTVTQGS